MSVLQCKNIAEKSCARSRNPSNNLISSALLFSFQVSGSISNTGHSVIFTVDNDTHHHINVTGGPLSYKYQFQEIHIHYGLHDQFGSEHSINGYAFPAEVSPQKLLWCLWPTLSSAISSVIRLVWIALEPYKIFHFHCSIQIQMQRFRRW